MRNIAIALIAPSPCSECYGLISMVTLHVTGRVSGNLQPSFAISERTLSFPDDALHPATIAR